MRRAGWALVLCAVAGVGCERLLTGGDKPAAQTIARSLAPIASSDGLIVDYILLERPAGDPFLNRDLWTAALPAGAPERRTLLVENGLRAGTLAGNVPTPFRTLIESESDTVKSHRSTFNNRKETVIPTAGPIDPCRFSVLADLAGKPAPVELKQANCGILVRPQPTPDGRVRLWCEPQIQHGDKRAWFRPNEDGTQFAKCEEVPLEKYPGLGFEVTLGPDDYLVIGWAADEPDSLGSVLFAVEAQGRPRQRLLVIRARQMAPSGPNDLKPITGPLMRSGK